MHTFLKSAIAVVWQEFGIGPPCLYINSYLLFHIVQYLLVNVTIKHNV